MGEDGESRAPFTAQASHDDIVRAGDGKYVGLVSEF
jgi:general secretion pathway protein G